MTNPCGTNPEKINNKLQLLLASVPSLNFQVGVFPAIALDPSLHVPAPSVELEGLANPVRADPINASKHGRRACPPDPHTADSRTGRLLFGPLPRSHPAAPAFLCSSPHPNHTTPHPTVEPRSINTIPANFSHTISKSHSNSEIQK